MDATAGVAIGSRRGLGRVKHIDTVFLWVKAMATEGKIAIGKKPTNDLRANLLTKHVVAATIDWIGVEVSIRREQADFESLRT